MYNMVYYYYLLESRPKIRYATREVLLPTLGWVYPTLLGSLGKDIFYPTRFARRYPTLTYPTKCFIQTERHLHYCYI